MSTTKLQCANASSAISIVEAGISNAGNEQLTNAFSSIAANFETGSNQTDFNNLQSEKAREPILSTDAGIAIDIKRLSLKAEGAMHAQSDPGSKRTCLMAFAPRKLEQPMSVTVLG